MEMVPTLPVKLYGLATGSRDSYLGIVVLSQHTSLQAIALRSVTPSLQEVIRSPKTGH